jgi:hypothetical protein
MSLSATVKASVSATQTRVLDIANGSASFNPALSISYSDGAGANQADLIWSDTRTIIASGTDELDLTGLAGSPQVAMTDVYGQTVTFARVKAIYVAAAAANTNNVNVVRPASNGFALFLAAGDGIALAPGDVFQWASPTAAGKVVTGGSADLLNLINSAGSTTVTYTIVIIGAAS